MRHNLKTPYLWNIYTDSVENVDKPVGSCFWIRAALVVAVAHCSSCEPKQDNIESWDNYYRDDDPAHPDSEAGIHHTQTRDGDYDGDRLPDDRDEDDDADRVPDEIDVCPRGALGWRSTAATDIDGDGCRDDSEDREIWVAGDPHIHFYGCSSDTLNPQTVMDEMERQDLHVVSALRWGAAWNAEPYLSFGFSDPLSTPDKILHYDIEVSMLRPAEGGHLLLHGLPFSGVVGKPFEQSGGSGIPLLTRGGIGQSARLRGHAHAWMVPFDGSFMEPPSNCCTPFELPVEVALGLLDHISIESNPYFPLSRLVWTKLQNSGFPIPMSVGSDYPCIGSSIGEYRTFARLSGPLTYPAFLDAIRAGRTTVATGGPGGSDYWVDFKLNGHRVGDELFLDGPKTVSITIDVVSTEETTVEIIANSDVAATLMAMPGRVALETTLYVSDSMWVYVLTKNAMTNPIYVKVNDQPIRPSTDDPCYFVQYIDFLSEYVQSSELDMGVDRNEALAVYADARAVYYNRFLEAGGVSCP